MAESFSYPADEYVLIGQVTKAHGIKGELKIIAFSGQLQSITQHKSLILVSRQGQITPAFKVVRSRSGNKEAIVHLKGVSDRNDAEKLCKHGVLVHKDDLPILGADELYLHELEGLQVKTEEGQVLGKVESFFSNGVQDILVVGTGEKEFLIPLIPGMISKRNETCVTIAPPPGLLDMNSGISKKVNGSHDI